MPAIVSPQPPILMARVLSRRLRLEDCVEPAELYSRLRSRRKRPGAVLLESNEQRATSGGRSSLVVPEPVLRLRFGAGQIELHPLAERARPLLDPLARDLADVARVPGEGGLGLRGRLSVAPPCETGTDLERLRSPSVLDLVRRLVTSVRDDDPLAGRALPVAVYGAFGFDLVDHFDVLPPRPRSADPEPDIDLVLGLDGVHYDHVEGRVTVVARTLAGAGLAGDDERGARERQDELCRALVAPGGARAGAVAPPRELSLPEVRGGEASFVAGVRALLEHIRAGDVFQCVLSRSLETKSHADPLQVYRRLVACNPSPFHFFFDTGDGELLGASPEPALLVHRGRVELRPIAGTRPRGRKRDGTLDPDTDARLAMELLFDPKEQAEHAMLVDLARNDLARICKSGTREMVGTPQIERYSHVQHLVSRVQGELLDELDALSAYRGCANMGTLTGAPKLRATELIRELELEPRGHYGGAVGFFTAEGDLTTAIAIRSLRRRGTRYRVQAGAGIVADSVPERELDETTHKLRAPLSALRAAERGAS